MDIDIDYLYNPFINRLYPENKNILLEPLSSIFRLLLLKYKPVAFPKYQYVIILLNIIHLVTHKE